MISLETLEAKIKICGFEQCLTTQYEFVITEPHWEVNVFNYFLALL